MSLVSTTSSALSENALKLLQCAISLDSHIVMVSIPLSCGHCVCKECIPETSTQTTNIICKLCNKKNEIINLQTCKESFTTKCLFETYLQDLFELLDNRIKATSKKLKNTKKEYERQVKSRINQVRSEIDERVDKLKSELDALRDDMNAKLDKILEEILQDVETNDLDTNIKQEYEVKLKKISKDIKKSKSQTDSIFIEYQKELINCNKLIDNSLKSSFDIKFKSSEFSMLPLSKQSSIVGDVLFVNNKCISSILSSFVELGNLNELMGWPRNREFKLIYRASSDGFSSDLFHLKCDNTINTLCLIKTKDDCIFGGFTTQTWNQVSPTNSGTRSQLDSQLKYYQERLNEYDENCGFKYDSKAFLFSYKNKLTRPFKIDIKDARYAIQCNNTCCMCFGQSDLWIYNNSNINRSSFSNLNRSYEVDPKVLGFELAEQFDTKTLLAGSYNFQVDNIEVFKVIFS